MVTSCENVNQNFNVNWDLGKVMKHCRVCLNCDGRSMNQIFSNDINYDILNISDRILFCTGVEIHENDGLPSQICDKCSINLDSAYQFKATFLESDKYLKQLLYSNQFKVENEHLNTKNDDFDYFDDADVKSYRSDNDVDIKEEPLKSEEMIITEKETKPIKKTKIETETENHIRLLSNTRKLKSSKNVNHKRSKFVRCKICELDFTNKVEAKEHQRRFHPKKVSWMCEICGKVFKHRASHITHLRSHRPPMFSCDQCDYKTSHKHDLVKHIRIHSGVKRYQCSYCAASFHVVSNLKSHERRTHQKVRDHTCPLCPRLFFDTAHLKRHIDSHNEVKRFTCDICGTAYSRRCYWVRHMERQHDHRVQPIRPGRQKTNFVVEKKKNEGAMK